MKKIILTVIWVALAICGFAQNYPFPMNEQGYTYPYGISATTPNNASMQAKFENWDKNMYRENTDGTMGRIRYDDENYTVSEGIAYGMLIYVYMTNETNTDCQRKFDNLYAYYTRWADNNGLMNWKIQGFDNVASGGGGGATDADLDVAFALCLAAKQWGSSSRYNYNLEAEKITNKVYDKEVTTKNNLKVFKPGDSWDNVGNACYFTMASVGVFKQAQESLVFTVTKDWDRVYTDGFTYLEMCERNGLWPNWSEWSGVPSARSNDSKDFGWDACRVPWRIGWDYVWFGTGKGKTMLDKTKELLAAKSASTNPGNAGYFSNIDGANYASVSNVQYGGNVAWTGSLACAYMTDAAYQSNLDIYYSSIIKTTGSIYYAQTLQVLYMILLSGNAANFFDLDNTPAVPVAPVVLSATTDGSAITLSCSRIIKASSNYSGFTVFKNGVALSNAISGMNVSDKNITLTLQNGTIGAGDIIAISYNGTALMSDQDVALGEIIKQAVKNNVSSNATTIVADCEGDNDAHDGNETLFGGKWYKYVGTGSVTYDIVPGGANSTDSCAYFTYNNIGDYGGMGFSFAPGEAPYDFSGSTGLSFYHKGGATTMEIGCTSTSDYSYHIFNVSAHANWTLVTVKWSDMQSAGWGAGKDLNFESDNLSSEMFKVQWKEITGSGSFYIDEVTMLGFGTSDIDRSALSSAITTANNLYGSATTASYPQNAINALSSAINAAATVNMTPSATQTQIDEATTTLNAAVSTFNASKYADKTPLATAISRAQKVSDAAVVGNDNGKYTQEDKDIFDAAIAAAQTQYDIAGLSESQMNAAIDELDAAVTAFNASVINIVDKEALKDLIDTATDILATTTAGTQVGQYSQTKRQALQTSLATAQTRYDSPTISQSAVDFALSGLREKYNLYMASVVTATAIDDVAIVLQVYPNPCTEYVVVEANQEIAYVTIVDMQGAKTVVEVGGNTTIPVATLKAGAYTLQIVFADGSTKTTRFVKK